MTVPDQSDCSKFHVRARERPRSSWQRELARDPVRDFLSDVHYSKLHASREGKLASPYMAKLEINPVHRLLYDCVILCHCTLAALNSLAVMN